MKPACHCREEMGCCWPEPPVEVRTTKPGRLRDSEPKPYHSHEPIAGLPGTEEPVFIKVWAGSWLIASVWSERMMQISSATVPMCGKMEEIDCPLLPNCLNSCCGPKHFSWLLPWSW